MVSGSGSGRIAWRLSRQATGTAIATASATTTPATNSRSGRRRTFAQRPPEPVAGGVIGPSCNHVKGAVSSPRALGPLLPTRLGARARNPRLLFGAFGLRGLVGLVLAAVAALPAAVAALVIYGLGTSTGNVTFSTLIQSHVPAELRGRVFAAFDLIWQSMRLASLLFGAVLADGLGIRAVFYVGGSAAPGRRPRRPDRSRATTHGAPPGVSSEALEDAPIAGPGVGWRH